VRVQMLLMLMMCRLCCSCSAAAHRARLSAQSAAKGGVRPGSLLLLRCIRSRIQLVVGA
jgi:hypothetical protein